MKTLSEKIEIAEKRKKELQKFLKKYTLATAEKYILGMIEADREVGNIEAYIKGILESKEFIKIIEKDNLEILENGLDAGILSYQELIEQINNNLKNRAGDKLT